jgi:Kdo2-lipid IVA lauroyltransferase/acyltransferase
MTAWFTGKVAYLSTWLGFKIGCVVVGLFPRATFRLADHFAALGFRLFRGFRTRSVNNLSRALGEQLDAGAIDNTARRSLRNFFRACIEIVMALQSSDEEFRHRIALSGREHLDAALAKGKGVLVLSAHLGNFFLVGSRLAIDGYPASVLVNQPRDGQFADLMDRYRLQVRQRTIHARPRRQALQELREVLRLNQIAVMIADEYRKTDGIPVTLFGMTVFARRGPVTLALRTGAAVVPAYLIRRPDDSLQLVIEPELQLARTGKSKEEIRDNTIIMTQWLERTVRQYPDQWNWMNLRWSDSSPAALNNHPAKKA